MTAHASNEQIRRALARGGRAQAPAWGQARAAWSDMDAVARARLLPDGAPVRVSYRVDALAEDAQVMLGRGRGVRSFEGREYLHVGIPSGLGDEPGSLPLPLSDLIEVVALSDLDVDRVELADGPDGYLP